MPLSNRTEHDLQRWLAAELIDPAAAGRIREFEQRDRPGLRWQSLLAIAFGGVMLAAGTLLFVAAHWDEMSPGSRFASVLALVAVFHAAAAALQAKSTALARVLHGCGTVALGASIFLTAQIFNLQEHWPNGVLLWALGAALAWWLLRDWVQGLLTALLAPAWLISEWIAGSCEAVTRANWARWLRLQLLCSRWPTSWRGATRTIRPCGAD